MSGKSKKAIEKIIMFKMMSWLKSIDNEELRNEVKRDLIVSGGCIASMLLGEDVNDYDVYLRNPETAKKLAEFYVSKLGDTKGSHVTKVEIDIEPTGGWLSHTYKVELDKDDYHDEEYHLVRLLKESGQTKEILDKSPIKQ